MLFGGILGNTSFGNAIALPQFLPIAWAIICAPTVAVVNENLVDDPGFEQTVQDLWIIQNPNSSGTLVREC